jgi:hypothetical protein
LVAFRMRKGAIGARPRPIGAIAFGSTTIGSPGERASAGRPTGTWSVARAAGVPWRLARSLFEASAGPGRPIVGAPGLVA